MPCEAIKSMTLVYDWDIRNVNQEYRLRQHEIRESEVFPLAGYHYGAKVKFESNFKIYLQLIDYNNTERPIDTKSMPKITYVIKDLVNTPDSRDIISTRSFSFQDSLEYGKDIFDVISFNIDITKAPPYLVSNGMKLRLYVEPPSIARSFFSKDGILLWRMDNYKERTQMAKDGLIWWQESPYFYTRPQGYRVKVNLYFKENMVDCLLCFLKGEFDSSLTYKFPHRFTMTIFNHTDQSKHLVLSQIYDDTKYTPICFRTATPSLLESGGYVKDDSLLIKAVVEFL